MARPPRNPNAPLFGMGQIVFSLFEGFVGLLAVLLVFGFSFTAVTVKPRCVRLHSRPW